MTKSLITMLVKNGHVQGENRRHRNRAKKEVHKAVKKAVLIANRVSRQ